MSYKNTCRCGAVNPSGAYRCHGCKEDLDAHVFTSPTSQPSSLDFEHRVRSTLADKTSNILLPVMVDFRIKGKSIGHVELALIPRIGEYVSFDSKNPPSVVEYVVHTFHKGIYAILVDLKE